MIPGFTVEISVISSYNHFYCKEKEFIKERNVQMAEYKILKTEGRAKRAEFHTVHGTIQTPVFMNVGTVGAIKGAVSTRD